MNNPIHYKTDFFCLRFSKIFFITFQIIIFIETYKSSQHNSSTIILIESIVLFIYFLSYTFYRFSLIPLQVFKSSLIVCISTLIIMSVFVIGYKPVLSLFTLMILPYFIFCILGIESGIKITLFTIFVLFYPNLNIYLNVILPLRFPLSFDLKIFIGYIYILFLYYKFEKQKQQFEKHIISLTKSQNVLLKEPNHRLKNILQMIIGLLLMQTKMLKTKECKKILTSQINRLKIIGLANEQLSPTKEAVHVNMKVYLQNIIDSLQFLTEHKIILYSDELSLDVSKAIYLGLFVNEAVSNAIKYAYLPNVSNEIKVSFISEKHIHRLIVEDYGQGFGETNFSNSLGLLLMKSIGDFMENGHVMFDYQNGTKVMLNFKS